MTKIAFANILFAILLVKIDVVNFKNPKITFYYFTFTEMTRTALINSNTTHFMLYMFVQPSLRNITYTFFMYEYKHNGKPNGSDFMSLIF